MPLVDSRWLSERLLELLEERPEGAFDDVAIEAPIALEELGHLMPVRLQRFDAPLEVALDGIQPRRPLLVLDKKGRPVILSERAGSRVSLEESSDRRTWLEPRDLALRLGVSDLGLELGFLSVDPREKRREYDDAFAPWREAGAILRGDTGDLGAIVVYAVGVGILSLALPSPYRCW